MGVDLHQPGGGNPVVPRQIGRHPDIACVCQHRQQPVVQPVPRRHKDWQQVVAEKLLHPVQRLGELVGSIGARVPELCLFGPVGRVADMLPAMHQRTDQGTVLAIGGKRGFCMFRDDGDMHGQG